MHSTPDPLLFRVHNDPAQALSAAPTMTDNISASSSDDALMILLPLLIVFSTLLFFLLIFLVCMLLLRRRRGILLRDNDGPIDLSREDLIEGEGGFEGVESRWLENASEEEVYSYRRAKEYQQQYPPNSTPTDITLSQFLSIQEKGVSAWSFEPEYESIPSALVHSRTEITFLPDPDSSSSVQSNLPLPKLNEVYYWEVKMFDLPRTTNVAVGLATKPYPPFRLPGLSRFSIAYHSSGDKSHNYPFTSQPFGPSLKEGDVLGIGYRPRTGTVFFTRNGRKLEDAFVGLGRWNLFPTVGADGPCSVHVNLGQAGFVFIEANVKKWGLAPSVGTLAPPPAYGSERGSILLEAGGDVRTQLPPPPLHDDFMTPSSSAPLPQRVRRSARRPRSSNSIGNSSVPVHSSPLRRTAINDHIASSSVASSIPPAIPEESSSATTGYISPTDAEYHTGIHRAFRGDPEVDEEHWPSDDDTHAEGSSSGSVSPSDSTTELTAHQRGPPSDITIPSSPLSPTGHNPPTPGNSDIGLLPMSLRGRRRGGTGTNTEAGGNGSGNGSGGVPGVEPPAYSPIDAYRYADGVVIDLPAEVIAAALEGAPQSGGSGSRQSRRQR
ncbi:hypothetical protein BOTBODRAFT_27332 [Botryobasidium botryosum FD-172 SS1]|uniref:B30.2/SPRY domain-containing protein n=1 Tax=Botryobasidium botryosum (strain FD-172 SS1) TaxID=930990 RepID=A0A067N835_BOTB1|nr:hypothetical protein BOTBODRAFT_27332 [Botryobasidium botryosum FD-172 SS1]